MDTQTIGRVVVMSIHPEYAAAIMHGTKLVEFRKRPLASDVTHVFVYATKPIGAIVGAFAVTGQKTENPSHLWDMFSTHAGIGREPFLKYYENSKLGTGIEIGEVFRASFPLSLETAFGIPRPPQSFQYVDEEIAVSILREFQRPEISAYRLRNHQLSLQACVAD